MSTRLLPFRNNCFTCSQKKGKKPNKYEFGVKTEDVSEILYCTQCYINVIIFLKSHNIPYSVRVLDVKT